MPTPPRTPVATPRPPEFLFGGDLSTPTRLAYGLAPLIQLLEARGQAVDPILAATEIPRFALEEPTYRITLAQELAFTRHALARLDDTLAALEIGRRFHLSMFGLVGLAASCAPSIREAFRIVLSYPALVWGLIEVTQWRHRDREYVAYEPGPVVAELGPFFVERDMAATFTLVRDAFGPAVTPSAVHLRRAAPSQARCYAQFFGCPVHFAASANELHFALEIWNAVPPQADTMSRRFFENQCRRLSESMQAPFTYTDIVRARLRVVTPIPPLSTLADELHLTARTLQRRLTAEDTSFSALLQETRRERACDLLRRNGLSIEEIAYRLGFRDPDAFSRAFSTWLGITPSEYRRSAVD